MNISQPTQTGCKTLESKHLKKRNAAGKETGDRYIQGHPTTLSPAPSVASVSKIYKVFFLRGATKHPRPKASSRVSSIFGQTPELEIFKIDVCRFSVSLQEGSSVSFSEQSWVIETSGRIGVRGSPKSAANSLGVNNCQAENGECRVVDNPPRHGNSYLTCRLPAGLSQQQL